MAFFSNFRDMQTCHYPTQLVVLEFIIRLEDLIRDKAAQPCVCSFSHIMPIMAKICHREIIIGHA